MSHYTPPASYTYATDKGRETVLVDRSGRPLLVREPRPVGFRIAPIPPKEETPEPLAKEAVSG